MDADAPATRPPGAAARTGRTLMVALWSVFLCWHIGFIYYLRWKKYIEWDTVGSSLETVSALYAPPFAAIGVFYWKGGWNRRDLDGAALRLALASALLWNLILLALTLAVLAGTAYIQDAYELSTRLGAVFVWLVAGSMSYAFARKEQEER